MLGLYWGPLILGNYHIIVRDTTMNPTLNHDISAIVVLKQAGDLSISFHACFRQGIASTLAQLAI